MDVLQMDGRSNILGLRDRSFVIFFCLDQGLKPLNLLFME